MHCRFRIFAHLFYIVFSILYEYVNTSECDKVQITRWRFIWPTHALFIELWNYNNNIYRLPITLINTLTTIITYLT